MKKLTLLLLCAIAILHAESFTFYLLVPEYKEWLETPPIVKNLTNGNVASMDRDATEYYGWYHYTWEKNSVPDSVFFFSYRDSSFLDPIGSNGFCDKNKNAFPMKTFSDLMDTVYFVADLFWKGVDHDVDEYGYATSDVRKKIHYSKDDSVEYYSKNLYVLVPDYKEWIDEIPVLVDATDSLKNWEMKPDGLNKGWFSYSWNYCSISPDSLYLYKKSDLMRMAPIGEKGFAYGETELIPLKFKDNMNVYFYPDLRYDCVIPSIECFCENQDEECYCDSYENVRWKSYDVRSVCQLRYDCLKDDFEPYYHDKVTVSARNVPKILTRSVGSLIQISSSKILPYVILNAMGQVIARGKVNGTTNVEVPNLGMYLVKVGSEVHRINVR